MNLIYKHANGGKLSQAGASEIPWDLKSAGIDCVIFAAAEKPPLNHFTGADLSYYPLEDAFTPNPQQFLEILAKAREAAREVAKRILDKQHVLSTCSQGFNRSGLVSALTLKKLTKLNNQEIINLIRKNRNPDALKNPSFIKMLDYS